MVSSLGGSRSQLRAIGIELRELRTQAGLSLDDLAAVAGVSRSTLSRLETGVRIRTSINWTRLLAALGATSGKAAEIMDLVTGAQQHPNWLAVGAQLPKQLATLIDFEKTAQRINSVTITIIPGLLQTRDYARAIFAGGGVPDREVDVRLAVRMDRQAVLSRVEYVAIIDERALGVSCPTVAPAVMSEQLEHIVTMAERPNVHVHVLPCSLGAHDALGGGSLITLEFPEPGKPVAHAENWLGGTFIDHAKTVRGVLERVARLRESALSPAESTELIRQLIEHMESTT